MTIYGLPPHNHCPKGHCGEPGVPEKSQLGLDTHSLNALKYLIDKTPIMEIKSEKENEVNNMLEKAEAILEVYKVRATDKIYEKHEIDTEAIIEKDENYIELKKHVDQLKLLGEKINKEQGESPFPNGFVSFNTERLYTNETKEALEKLNIKRDKEISKAQDVMVEVRAQLCLVADEKEARQILKCYKILNKDGKIND